MDNKIKIVVSVFLFFFFSSCVGWLEDDSFYERPLNNWASVKYFSNQGYRGEVFNVSFSTRDTFLKNERIDVGVNSEYKDPMVTKCIKIIYNNYYVLGSGKYRSDTIFYKIVPTFAENKQTPNGYNIDTISKSNFDVLVKECTDCQELDADKIRAMDYELDHGGFPTKTVIFILLVIAYIFYRIKKKKSKKK